jgi:hypothetical protein
MRINTTILMISGQYHQYRCSDGASNTFFATRETLTIYCNKSSILQINKHEPHRNSIAKRTKVTHFSGQLHALVSKQDAIATGVLATNEDRMARLNSSQSGGK